MQRFDYEGTNNDSTHFSSLHSCTPSGALTSFRAPLSSINSHYFNIAFAGQPLQCNKHDGTCTSIAKEYRFEKGMNEEEMGAYRYVLDVDGNGPSSRFRRIMLVPLIFSFSCSPLAFVTDEMKLRGSRSVVLKSTGFVEWWTLRIMPVSDLTLSTSRQGTRC